MRRPAWCAVLLAAGAWAFGPVAATCAPPHDPAPSPADWDPSLDPLLSAAPDTWPMQDACAGHTRATRTRPVRGPTEVAWTFTAPGPIEGDPRVWQDLVVVSSNLPRPPFDRYVDVLRLSDGKPVVSRKVFPAGGASPVLWRDRLAVSSQGEMQLYRIVPELGMLTLITKYAGARLALVGDGLLLVSSEKFVGVVRMDRGEPVWDAYLGSAVAHSIAAGAGVALVQTEESRQGFEGVLLRLAAYDLRRGEPTRQVDLGWSIKAPERPLDAVVGIVEGAGEDFVLLSRPVSLEGGQFASASRVPHARAGFGRPVLTDIERAPLAWGPISLCVVARTDGPLSMVAPPLEPAPPGTDPAAWTFRVLATAERHPEYLGDWGPAFVAGGLAYLRPGVFDLRSGKVVGDHPFPSALAVVPARETMLVVEAGGRLTARRGPKRVAGAGPRLSVPEGQAKTDVPQAVAVTCDGAVRTGGVSLAAAGSRLSGLGKGVATLADVGLLLDREGKIVHAPEADFAARALVRVCAPRTLPEWAGLARRAVGTNDPDLSQECAGALAERGGSIDDLVALRRDIERLRRPSAVPRPVDAKKVAELRAKASALLAAETAMAWKAFASLPGEVPLAYRTDLLRPFLERNPGHADALAWLRARLPEGVVPPAVRDPLDWLDVVEATAQAPVRGVAAREGRDLPPDERVLAAARAAWRPDLVGIRSDRLLLVTPVTSPGRIARCLSLGELVCSSLDALFGVAPTPGADLDPLVIHLYESREEYLTSSHAGDAGDERSWLAMTAGHYDPGVGISRLYVPSGRDAFEQVSSVFAHELTHHWLDTRMPPPAGARRGHERPASPGYFLEEGFATLVEEALFDARARTWTPLDPRADSLDVVVNSPRLVPWADVLQISQSDFRRLASEPIADVPTRWRLGVVRKESEVSLFYAQAAAACHWMLNAQGGQRRPTLLRWLQDLHAGRTQAGDVERRIGASPAAAGDAIRAWCQGVSDGAR